MEKDRAKDKNKKGKSDKSEKPAKENPCIYIYDEETGEWKVINPSGSIAYNCLIRDEWSWLD